MREDTLQEVVEIVRTQPRSAAALNLYALVSTLRMEKSGYMYMLRKLRELDPAHRRLAYGLMELMAEHGNQGEAWEAAVRAMDAAVRGG
jgi:hypothetical protein